MRVMPEDATNTTMMKLKPAQGGRGFCCEAMMAVAPPTLHNTVTDELAARMHHDSTNKHIVRPLAVVTFTSQAPVEGKHS